MTFAEHYRDAVSQGLPDTATTRAFMECMWDTAICEAQAACMDRGQFRSPSQIHAALSTLHTWHKPEPPLHP